MGAKRKSSQNLIRYLKLKEGFEPRVYNDLAGYATIGYGHKLTPEEIADQVFKAGVTPTLAEKLLKQDLLPAEKSVNNNVQVPLNKNQFDALVDFVYNVGSGNFSASTALKDINRKHWPAVAGDLALFNKVTIDGKKVVSKGLVKRRAEEGEIFNSPPGSWPVFG
jgi:lysozyme